MQSRFSNPKMLTFLIIVILSISCMLSCYHQGYGPKGRSHSITGGRK